MKTLKIMFSVVLALIFSGSFTPAQQQDYKIVQDFKAKYHQIENDIKNAESLAQLNDLEIQINQMETTYSVNKELLDKSLYPEDFNSSIQKLRKELSVRKTDFTQITTLETQVTQLNLQVDDLNRKNNSLLVQVRDLTEQSKIDKNKISQLQKTINTLRSSLRKRDELVMDMIDSLIPADYNNSGTLSGQDKQKVFSEAQKKSIIENVQNAIRENIKFLQVTNLNPDDIKSIKERQQQFEKTWQSFGPKIIEIYIEKGKYIQEAQKIDGAFEDWHKAINMEAWNSIGEKYANYGINLNRFSSGKEFTQVIKDYTQDEIKNAKVKGEASFNDYTTFADTAWFGNIKPNWVPFLIDNNMLTEAQKDTIEANIAQWKEVASPDKFNWLYIIIGALVIVIIVLLVRRNSNKKVIPMNSGEAKS